MVKLWKRSLKWFYVSITLSEKSRELSRTKNFLINFLICLNTRTFFHFLRPGSVHWKGSCAGFLFYFHDNVVQTSESKRLLLRRSHSSCKVDLKQYKNFVKSFQVNSRNSEYFVLNITFEIYAGFFLPWSGCKIAVKMFFFRNKNTALSKGFRYKL